MRQKDLNWLVGYSSVAHMGFIFLGIAALNMIRVTGAVLVIIAHGFLATFLSVSLGWLLSTDRNTRNEPAGRVARQVAIHRRRAAHGGGVCRLAGCPGFGNFAGEVTVFFRRMEIVCARGRYLPVGRAPNGRYLYVARRAKRKLHGPLGRKLTGSPVTLPNCG